MIDHAYITIYTSYYILLNTYETTYYACIEHENTISSIQHKYNAHGITQDTHKQQYLYRAVVYREGDTYTWGMSL